MSDYVYCLQSPSLPGLLRIESSKVDPHTQPELVRQRVRAGLSDYQLIWAVRVLDGAAAAEAVRRALAGCAHDDGHTLFRCDPMDARGEAIRFITVREAPERKKRGWISKLIPAADERAA